jgi:hypothetical protein
MTSLDAKYSEGVDRVLAKRLDDARAEGEKKSKDGKSKAKDGSTTSAQFKALSSLLAVACSGTRHQMVAGVGRAAHGTDTTLFLALSHHQTAVRISAIDSLEELIGNGSVDNEYASRTLLMRLDDDSCQVIERVLRIPGLRKIIPVHDLITRLLSLMATLSARLPGTRHANQMMMSDPSARAAHKDNVHLLCVAMEFVAADVFPSRVAATTTPNDNAQTYLSYLLEFLLVRPLTATLSRTCLQIAAKLSQRFPLFRSFDTLVATHGDALSTQEESKEEKNKSTIAINQAIVQQMVIYISQQT